MKLPDTNQDNRSYGPDNLKFLLIVTVVVGHLIEISPSSAIGELIHSVIYVFHMPAFIYLAGYFARFSRKRIILQLAYTYILFQALYLAFDYFVLSENPKSGFVLEFAFPYWIMWYLLVLFLFFLLIPLVDVNGTKKRLAVLIGSFVLSLLVGFDDSIGNYASLSRIFSFLPFFVMGFYQNKSEKETGRIDFLSSVNPNLIRVLLTASVIGSICYLMVETRANRFVLYRLYSYRCAFYDIGIKSIVTIFATVWIAFLIIVVLPLLNRKIPLMSAIGRNSLPIYLLHGFLIRLLEKHNVLSDGRIWPLLVIIIGTPLILILCGNSITARIFNFVFTGNWIESLLKRISSKSKKINVNEHTQ